MEGLDNNTTELRALSGKEVLITGGTGTLGKALLKELSEYSLKGLRIFSRDEFKQWKMREEYKETLEKANFPVAFFLGDVRDPARLKQAFKGVDVVIHTAAMKQVPACEYNPFEAIQTNILGTENVCRVAIETGVRHVMFISTDKAVYPVNLYGATKATAEKTVIASNVYSPNTTKFNVCRYGNVIGSRGSVVQLFEEQLEKGQALTMTDERMTRFWITSTFMARFILKAIGTDSKETIFVPFMKAATVMKLAYTIAGERIKQIPPIKEIGIRKGEKLHECLISEEETLSTKIGSFCYLILNKECPSSASIKSLTSKYAAELTSKELEDMIYGKI